MAEQQPQDTGYREEHEQDAYADQDAEAPGTDEIVEQDSERDQAEG